ncbi:MAG: CRISPR-associated endonuclease Cas2 [Gammaproteobacteria bacterium]|nr:MAG: CRISPR-associated endonuclease Cas2 [Gammaproteobacteria bacterium]
MMSDKRWYLVSYDIRDDKRWRRAYKQLQGRGERIHYSLFRCRLNRTEMEALRWELETILDDEDDLMFIHLCPRCAGRVRERGKGNDWNPPSDRFEVL